VKTVLRDRILYYDGTCQVKPEQVPQLFLSGLTPDKACVTEINDDIALFNSLSDIIIGTAKNNINDLDFSWKVPKKYLELDLESFILQKIQGFDSAYTLRAAQELEEIKKRQLDDLFRTLIYVIDVLRESNTLWGVGRGSACASLVLHLIGLHCVDPIKFNISMEEFFHD
jgi:DNA polymerase III alpha subunit